MVHHQRREHDIERLIRERKAFDYSDLEIDGRMTPRSLRASAGDLNLPWIDACHAARSAYAACCFQRQRSCTAAGIQHLLTRLQMGQADGLLPEFAQLAAKQEDVSKPYSQVVAPASVEDEPACHSGRLGCFVV